MMMRGVHTVCLCGSFFLFGEAEGGGFPHGTSQRAVCMLSTYSSAVAFGSSALRRVPTQQPARWVPARLYSFSLL
jgi:hypothetical protein